MADSRLLISLDVEAYGSVQIVLLVAVELHVPAQASCETELQF